MEKLREIDCVELRTVCDLYDGNITRAREHATNDKLKITKDWEEVINHPDIGAVVIATPGVRTIIQS